VGYLILTGLTDPNHVVCMKRIANQIKGRGYGKEAIRLIIEWVFENPIAFYARKHLVFVNPSVVKLTRTFTSYKRPCLQRSIEMMGGWVCLKILLY
jgi:hypothetical protein